MSKENYEIDWAPLHAALDRMVENAKSLCEFLQSSLKIDEKGNAYFDKPVPKFDCQDEPRLIATTPEEADEILDMWEAGK